MSTLNRLERIVSRDMSVVTRHKHSVNEVTATYLIEDFPTVLHAEAGRIKSEIMEAVADMTHQDHLRRYIRKCQYQLVSLNAKLLRYSNADKLVEGTADEAQTPIEVLCHFLYRCLNDLIDFLEQHFGRYIYWNAWVDRNFLIIARKQVHSSFLKTTQVLNECVNCDTLRTVLRQTFERFLDEEILQEVTYARIRYIRELQEKINRHTGEEGLDELLLTMNFNSRKYVQYWTQRLEDHIALKPTFFEKLELLASESRGIRQHSFVRKAAYNPKALSLPEMMTRWVKEEVDLQERLHNSSAVQDTSALSLGDKVELGVSVAVLAAAIRALISSKTMSDDNVTGLARMLSNCFTTIRSGGAFSPGTFRQSYYDITESTRKSCVDIFQRAITWLNNNHKK